ncbi:MAG: aldose 1-epimerase family protein [Erysipelotrichaceae bacterium]|nr:aldose 1-epimerase family protein [Erysipelotrichaceae bacterium]
MNYLIENDEAVLIVNTKAAEIHSFRKKNDDYEYMWNGNKEYWAGRNPILFPQVSSTPTKTNIIYGKEYPMGNHGFARNSEFELFNRTDDSLTFLLKENEETLKQYPFEFNLFVTYELKNTEVKITYNIVNNSDKVMPFGFGQHPAFNCPEGFKDTKIVMDDKDELVISDELFDKYPTVVYDPNPYKKAVLYANNHELEVDFEGYNILAVWSPHAPFVCIEPWMSGNPDPGLAFEDRPHSYKLSPGENQVISYSIILR